MRQLEGVTPPEVADLIQDVIKDKVVCDVGCGEGTFMESLNKYAAKVIGIEEEESWAKTAAEKGFDVWNTSSWFQPLPPADVYFLWSKDALGVYLKAKWEGTKGTFVFGHTVRPSLTKLLGSLKGERREIPNTIWWVFITKL